MTVSSTKTTEELDSAKKGRELPAAGNKQRQGKDGSGVFRDVEPDSSSQMQKDYGDNGQYGCEPAGVDSSDSRLMRQLLF